MLFSLRKKQEALEHRETAREMKQGAVVELSRIAGPRMVNQCRLLEKMMRNSTMLVLWDLDVVHLFANCAAQFAGNI